MEREIQAGACKSFERFFIMFYFHHKRRLWSGGYHDSLVRCRPGGSIPAHSRVAYTALCECDDVAYPAHCESDDVVYAAPCENDDVAYPALCE